MKLNNTLITALPGGLARIKSRPRDNSETGKSARLRVHQCPVRRLACAPGKKRIGYRAIGRYFVILYARQRAPYIMEACCCARQQRAREPESFTAFREDLAANLLFIYVTERARPRFRGAERASMRSLQGKGGKEGPTGFKGHADIGDPADAITRRETVGSGRCSKFMAIDFSANRVCPSHSLNPLKLHR